MTACPPVVEVAITSAREPIDAPADPAMRSTLAPRTAVPKPCNAPIQLPTLPSREKSSCPVF